MPSNEVSSKSVETPGTGAAFVDRQFVGGWQVAERLGDAALLDEAEVAIPEAASMRATDANMTKRDRALHSVVGRRIVNVTSSLV